jgi:uncharacterized protein (DUF4415 family)
MPTSRKRTGTRRVEPTAKARRIDYSDIPELDENWFKAAKLERPDTKERITVRIDRDLIAYFKRKGGGYQTRMNAALRAYMDADTRSTQRRSRSAR